MERLRSGGWGVGGGRCWEVNRMDVKTGEQTSWEVKTGKLMSGEVISGELKRRGVMTWK